MSISAVAQTPHVTTPPPAPPKVAATPVPVKTVAPTPTPPATTGGVNKLV